jgi:hypothetical protein
MAVMFIFGKPGGGKSLYAFRQVIDELVNGSRPVVTNLPIIPGRLNEWLQSQGHSIDLHQRLRLIDTDELRQWWRYRGRGPDGEWVTLPEAIGSKKDDDCPPGRQRGSTDMRSSPGPVFYALDEIHTSFNARAWMDTGMAAIWYLSQHRKLGDTVLMISQTPGQVDKQLRSMSQEFVNLTNLSKLTAFFIFRMPMRILWTSYPEQPVKGTPVLATNIMRIDSPGWADCYDTAQGNGIAGSTGADKADKKRAGLPLWTLVLLPLIAMAVLWWGPSAAVGGVMGWVGKDVPAQVSGPLPQAPAPVVSVHPQEMQEHRELPPLPPAPVQEPEPLKLLGWYAIGNKIHVILPTGEVVTPREGLKSWDGQKAVVRGKTYVL